MGATFTKVRFLAHYSSVDLNRNRGRSLPFFHPTNRPESMCDIPIVCPDAKSEPKISQFSELIPLHHLEICFQFSRKEMPSVDRQRRYLFRRHRGVPKAFCPLPPHTHAYTPIVAKGWPLEAEKEPHAPIFKFHGPQAAVSGDLSFDDPLTHR